MYIQRVFRRERAKVSACGKARSEYCKVPRYPRIKQGSRYSLAV